MTPLAFSVFVRIPITVFPLRDVLSFMKLFQSNHLLLLQVVQPFLISLLTLTPDLRRVHPTPILTHGLIGPQQLLPLSLLLVLLSTFTDLVLFRPFLLLAILNWFLLPRFHLSNILMKKMGQVSLSNLLTKQIVQHFICSIPWTIHLNSNGDESTLLQASSSWLLPL